MYTARLGIIISIISSFLGVDLKEIKKNLNKETLKKQKISKVVRA